MIVGSIIKREDQLILYIGQRKSARLSGNVAGQTI